jgi:hypothetical protein
MKRAPFQVALVAAASWLLGAEITRAQFGGSTGSPTLQNPPINASSQVRSPSGFEFGPGDTNAINSGMTFNGAFGERALGNGAGLMGGSNGFASAQQDTGQYGLYGIIGQNNGMSQYGGMQNSFRNGLNQYQSGAQGNSVVVLQVPMHFTVGFSYPAQSTALVSQKLSTELSKSRGITALSPIVVQMEGTTAVINGTVATEHDRDLAAQLALLEPGVYNVRNDLHLQIEGHQPSENLPAPPNPRLPDLPAP